MTRRCDLPCLCGIHPKRCRCNGLKGGKRPKFFVADDCHPQTIALVQTRGSAINLDIVVSYYTDSEIQTVFSQPIFSTIIYPSSTLDISPTEKCCDPRLSVSPICQPCVFANHGCVSSIVQSLLFRRLFANHGRPSSICLPCLSVTYSPTIDVLPSLFCLTHCCFVSAYSK